jgi:hypothetical protein
MLRNLVLASAAAVMVAAPVSAQPVPAAPDAGKLDRLVERCRVYVRILYLNNDGQPFSEYVDRLLRDRSRNQAEIVACGAYLLGAADMAEGRIVQPGDPRR